MQARRVCNEHRGVEDDACPCGCGGLGELVGLVHAGDLLHLAGVNSVGHTLSRRRCQTCRSSPPGARRDNYCRCIRRVGGCSADARIGPADPPGGLDEGLPQEFFPDFFLPRQGASRRCAEGASSCAHELPQLAPSARPVCARATTVTPECRCDNDARQPRKPLPVLGLRADGTLPGSRESGPRHPARCGAR